MRVSTCDCQAREATSSSTNGNSFPGCVYMCAKNQTPNHDPKTLLGGASAYTNRFLYGADPPPRVLGNAVVDNGGAFDQASVII